MSEIDADVEVLNEEYIEFSAERMAPLSSGVLPKIETETAGSSAKSLPDVGEALSPVFKELANPDLPPLPKENRARLQMQSPNRLFFYWSIKTNPFHTLNRAFGNNTGSYTLVLRFIDLRRDTEAIYPADPEGSWWFDAEAGSEYRAEIGFYAPNRPFIRILHSNTVQTPRRSPSPRPAGSADWSVSADKFARVLDAAGFVQDAFDVAMAGDDPVFAETAARSAFTRLVGRPAGGIDDDNAGDIRYALLALASGMPLAALRGRIGPALFALLEANIDQLRSERAAEVLRQEFGVEADEMSLEQPGAAVFGSSLVNFPRVLRKRIGNPGPRPLSSLRVGR